MYGIQDLVSFRFNAGGGGGANEGIFGIHVLGFPRLNTGGGVGWKRDGVDMERAKKVAMEGRVEMEMEMVAVEGRVMVAC